jgi:hypothetical protein
MSYLSKECADPGCAESFANYGSREGLCAVFTELDIAEGVPGATDPRYCPMAHYLVSREAVVGEAYDLPVFDSTAA